MRTTESRSWWVGPSSFECQLLVGVAAFCAFLAAPHKGAALITDPVMTASVIAAGEVAAPKSTSLHTVLVPEQQTPSPSDLGFRFFSELEKLTELEVNSRQRVSYLTRSLEGASDASDPERRAIKALEAHQATAVVNVTIDATMTKDSFDVVMWKDGWARPAMELSLADGMVTEKHWYPKQNRYRGGEPYPALKPEGINSLTTECSLFTEIPARVCATAEFYQTWLGGSWQAGAFRELVARGSEVSIVEEESEILFEVFKAPEPDDEGDYQARTDTFRLDERTGLLTFWRTENVHIRFGVNAGYLVVERDYSYRLPG